MYRGAPRPPTDWTEAPPLPTIPRGAPFTFPHFYGAAALVVRSRGIRFVRRETRLSVRETGSFSASRPQANLLVLHVVDATRYLWL